MILRSAHLKWVPEGSSPPLTTVTIKMNETKNSNFSHSFNQQTLNLTSQIEFYQIGLLKYSWIYGGGGGATVSQSRKNWWIMLKMMAKASKMYNLRQTEVVSFFTVFYTCRYFPPYFIYYILSWRHCLSNFLICTMTGCCHMRLIESMHLIDIIL